MIYTKNMINSLNDFRNRKYTGLVKCLESKIIFNFNSGILSSKEKPSIFRGDDYCFLYEGLIHNENDFALKIKNKCFYGYKGTIYNTNKTKVFDDDYEHFFYIGIKEIDPTAFNKNSWVKFCALKIFE